MWSKAANSHRLARFLRLRRGHLWRVTVTTKPPFMPTVVV
jgi:hypothetical protein